VRVCVERRISKNPGWESHISYQRVKIHLDQLINNQSCAYLQVSWKSGITSGTTLPPQTLLSKAYHFPTFSSVLREMKSALPDIPGPGSVGG
jgi:hypothetical protein